VDSDTKQLIEAIDNTAGKEAAHGAGISAAAQIADKGLEALLTGMVGPKA
jgi:predicted Fe-Mo cluster-binding NifX family protein